MSKNLFFRDYYRVDKDTGSYMIEIALNQYTDIFSVWDPVPFKKRAINPDLEFYLVSSAEEIPIKYPIELVFLMQSERLCAQLEDESRKGLRNSLIFKAYLLKKQMRETYSRLLRYVFLSIVFLWLGLTFPEKWGPPVWNSILKEGLVIGGWVFLWEAISLFSFTEFDLFLRSRTYHRLHNAPVIFRYVEGDSDSIS